ncbi:MAG TPA: hypothetical protein P5519_13010 [Spirochaetia bacterium]|nr:hypothetical protein [Spirochaetales bacterium]HOT59606.1 hypothetical protein [Spirochaetales bacterium]HPD81447.1 hypothetical protein [Spirochaetales bacterium]HQG40344.1 hypothetical protein [Spirochaetales bacterium]HRS66794.1 hypothetical protein [Spirochaetia bacterium]
MLTKDFERANHTCTAQYSSKKSGFLKYKKPVRLSFSFEERQPGFFEFDTVFHD